MTPPTTVPDPVRELASGLWFPEGPVALADGTMLVVEIGAGTVTAIATDGSTRPLASVGGGPNGAAIGPDRALYVANNGGFLWTERAGRRIPIDPATHTNEPPGFTGGWIERIDLATGEVTVLYKECDARPLRGPNDLVFDADGGMWFTDHGKGRHDSVDRGGLFYAAADGSRIAQLAYPLLGPNGVGLSPEGDRVYVAETHTGRNLGMGVGRTRSCDAGARQSGHPPRWSVPGCDPVFIRLSGRGGKRQDRGWRPGRRSLCGQP